MHDIHTDITHAASFPLIFDGGLGAPGHSPRYTLAMDETAELKSQDEIAELRRKLEEERRQLEQEIEEERRLFRKAKEIIESTEQRLQEREKAAQYSRQQTLQQYIEACHSLHLRVQVVIPPPYASQEDETNAPGLIFPRRMIPWDNFATKQEETWNSLSAGDLFHTGANFPSKLVLDYVRSRIKPIGSERGLWTFECFVVENAVEVLFECANADLPLRSHLGLRGAVGFERHEVPGDASSMAPTTPIARRKARGMGNREFESFIYSTSDGKQTPAVAIEYVPPHKLSVDQIITALDSEIWLERDVINKEGDDFASTSRRLTVAIVTQLFSYMVGKGLQYGYVCTGVAYIFLHIPADPSTVYYSVCVPSLDVMDDDDTRLHRTAAAQVFAFVLQALRAEPLPEEWHDKAEQLLGLWEVEYDDIVDKIPPSERKRKGNITSLYKAQHWEGFKQSPLRIHSRCREPNIHSRNPVDEGKGCPLPAPEDSLSVGNVATTKKTISIETEGGEHGQVEQHQEMKPHIRSRPFCSQECLLGLVLGKAVDRSCPNADSHGQMHITHPEFLRLIRAQLAVDRGRDADCMPMYRSGSRGSLFKARLSSHGYTLLAKGMETLDHAHLQHENEIYDRLLPIQGKYIPVCVGSIDLIRPYYYDCGVYTRFMFLSWAGRPIFECTAGQVSAIDVADATTRIFKAIHELRVLHRDAEPRNILFDEHSGRLMAVDFERSGVLERPPLSPISQRDRQDRKKYRELQKQKKLEKDRQAEMLLKPGMAKYEIARRRGKREMTEDDFAAELKLAVYEVSRCVANLKQA